MRNPYLTGEGIYLRPWNPAEDSAITLEWFNDAEVTRFMRRYLPITLPEQMEFLRGTAGHSSNMSVAIVETATDRLIGACGLHEIHPRHRHASIGITIGDKSCWGKGHGTEAMRLLVRHAFMTLNLNRLWLEVYDFNQRARRVYEKLGFQVEGQLRQDYFIDGAYHDTIIMGLLRDEWLAAQAGTS